jgi:uncharacterized damage-inducible protein DinB
VDHDARLRETETMDITRVDPPYEADERHMLESWLEFHRATLQMKCDGLSDDQLRERSVPPSSLSLLGLIRHLADVERNWFRWVLSGEHDPGLFWTDDHEDGDFDDVDDARVDEAFDAWRAECMNAREVAARLQLEDTGARRNGAIVSLRWVFVHMIEEYARHNGHADFLRERIDGVTGD